MTALLQRRNRRALAQHERELPPRQPVYIDGECACCGGDLTEDDCEWCQVCITERDDAAREDALEIAAEARRERNRGL